MRTISLRAIAHGKTDTSLLPPLPCHKLCDTRIRLAWHRRFTTFRYAALLSYVNESRNHGAHVDPVASSLLFINTGFTYPTPRIRTCPEKRSRTKGGEEIRTRIERGRGSIDGKSGRKLYHLSPRINILWDSIRHPFPLATGSSLFSFIKPYLRKSVSLRLRIRDCKTMAPRECRIKSENRSRGRDIGEGFLRDAGETDSPFSNGKFIRI